MLAVHAYKWLLSPNGAGFMYVSPRVREWLQPSVIGWRSHSGWRNHDNLHHGAPEFKTEAEKYEGGMLTFAVLYAMAASLEMFLTIGPETIACRVADLAEKTRAVLRAAGASLLSDRYPHYDSPIIGARFDGQDAPAIARRLREHKVLVAARHGNLRVSPHFYNNEDDVEQLASALKTVTVG
jgi:selenocysteine lyase/cysteine desulfurase